MLKLILKKTANNLFCTVINKKGNVIVWSSAGIAGFKGPARNTPYGAEKAGQKLGELLRRKSIWHIDFLFLYNKFDRKSRDCIKGLYSTKISIGRIYVYPLLAHNGVRRSKRKRR